MKVIIDNKEIEVIIKRKRTNKRTYLRIDDNQNILITTNYLTSEGTILKLINDIA